MRRKLVQHGLSSLITTLPSKWVDEHNLKRGDEVDIVEQSGALIITADSNDFKRSLKLDMTEKKFLKRYVNSAYISGYDEIIISVSKKFELAKLKKAVGELIGYEIVDQTDNKIVIQTLSETNENIENVVRRIFHLLNAISKQIVSDNVGEIEELDSLINKLRFFCCRQINKRGTGTRELDTYAYLQLSRVEEVGDEYRILADIVMKKKGLQIEIKSVADKISDYVSKITNEYFKPTVSNLAFIKKLRMDILDSIKKSISKSKNKEIYLHLYTIMHVLRHIEGTLLYVDEPYQKE